MTWFRVDDGLCGHRKTRRAGLPAMGLWTVAGSYSSQQLLDGFVPDWFVTTWPSGRKHAAALVTAGLWTAAEHDGDQGWQFHDWEQCNPLPPEFKRAWIPSALRELVVSRDGLVCGLCHGVVEGSDVHIDHVVPVVHGGSNDPVNLQVAHSRCNLRKGGRVR